jgi:hypothetical protein
MDAATAETVVLLDLPSELLLRVLSSLDGTALARACAACGAMNALGTSPLWERLCNDVGAPKRKGSESSKLRYRRYSETRCRECRLPTRYEFAPLGCRLCERCERFFPNVYGLATREQLMTEASSTASALQDLSAAALDDLFAQLPSHRCAGFVFFVRSVVAAAAEAITESSGCTLAEVETEEAEGETEDADDGAVGAAGAAVAASRCSLPEGGAASEASASTSCGVVGASSTSVGADTHGLGRKAVSRRREGREGGDGLSHGGNGSAEDGLSESDLDMQAARWDAAAADHSRHRSARSQARSDRKAALKEDAKLRKRMVKQEARLRRMSIAVPGKPDAAGPPPPAASCRRAGGHHARLQHKSAHVIAAREDELARQFRMLERAFGDGLAGLSGLVLAADRGAE